MSGTNDTTSRDTQFQGFANALWDEISREFGDWWDTDNAFAGDQAIELIARRAYDLAVHAVKHAYDINEYGDVGPLEDEEARLRVGRLPDLAELPKEQERE